MNKHTLIYYILFVAISLCSTQAMAVNPSYPKSNDLKYSILDTTTTSPKWTTLMGLMNRIRGEYSVSFQGYDFNAQNIQLQLLNDQASEYQTSVEINPGVSLSVIYGFYISKRFYLAYGLNGRLGKNVLNKNNQIMLGYNGEIKAFKKSIYIEPYSSYYFSKSGYLLGTYSGSNKFSFGSVPLIANKSLLYVGEKQQGLVFGLGFRIDVISFLSLMVGGTYYQELTNTPGLFNSNKHLFYTRSGFTTFNENTSYSEDGILKTQSSFKLKPWSFKIGFMFSL